MTIFLFRCMRGNRTMKYLVRGGNFVKEKKIKVITWCCFISLWLLLAAQIHLLDQINEKLDAVSKERYPAYLLINELRQSTFSLMLFARQYIEKHDSKYEQYYQTILAIRAGEKPRPKENEGAYWQYGMVDKHILYGAGKKASLYALIEENYFSREEMNILQRAETLAEALASTEQIAMDASKGIVSTDNQKKMLAGESIKDFSARIINDDAYEEKKQSFIKTLNKMIKLLEEHTNARSGELLYQRGMIRAAGVLTILLLGINLYVISAWFSRPKRRVKSHRRTIRS